MGEVVTGGVEVTHNISTVLCASSGPDLPGIRFNDVYHCYNGMNLDSPCDCYQLLLDDCEADVIIYVHDDVTVHDSLWLTKILEPFYLSHTVAVGLGGAVGLGHPDIYKHPYDIWQLARRGYASNQTDAEVHGERFDGVKRVAVLDAFFMAVRTDWLRHIGGWPTKYLTHHCLDMWLACEAARHKKATWLVGASVTHHGGGTSTKPTYKDAKWLQGGTLESDHAIPHRWLYDNYRDVLPILGV